MTTKDEQLVEQLDAEIRAIEAADPTETSGAALLRGAKEEIERLQAELADNKFLLKGSRETFDKQRKRIEKAERELAEAQAETWKADGEAERKLAEALARGRKYSEELGLKDAREVLLLGFVKRRAKEGNDEATALLDALETCMAPPEDIEP